MYNILFSFLKPQIAFGGDSGGGGGGGGGGSRADKKGAAAVLSPVYTPPVNATTFNDNNDRRDPVVVPAPVSEPFRLFLRLWRILIEVVTWHLLVRIHRARL